MAQLPQEILAGRPQLSVQTEAHVIYALRRKRSEISGHIHDLEKRIARQRANLVSLDITIRLFSPGTNPDAIPPKRPYRRTRYFARNELSRLTQEALRKASMPLTSAEIAEAVMQAKGMPVDDAAFKEIVAERTLTVLRRLAKREAVVKSGTSRDAKWALMRVF
jgi:DNA-binding transcriptional MerR regulator